MVEVERCLAPIGVKGTSVGLHSLKCQVTEQGFQPFAPFDDVDCVDTCIV
jgi:hypothetical protein